MYSYWADMESSGGYSYGYSSFNNNPSSQSHHYTPPFPSPVVNQTPSADRGVHEMDPHVVTCLKLGKRQHLDNSPSAAEVATYELVGKKGKPYGGELGASSAAAAVVKCQVDGCQAALVRAKEYHRRHKVCEVHAKAAMVVVLGVDQRFCQQCSRFHAVSEFDESKRSCRRRLAGHNKRRRKSSNDSITAISHGRALSLLSSMTNGNYMISPSSDLSLRSSAALRELIDEHRATNTTILAGNHQNYNYWEPRFQRQGERQVTLDLMQAPPLHTLQQQNTINSSKAKELRNPVSGYGTPCFDY